MQYELKQVGSILVVIVPDKFDRAMLFCRVQEYYESSNDNFRGKYFDIWDYLKWHQQEFNCAYWELWEGFNVPVQVAKGCEGDTKYDALMEFLCNDTDSTYIIGVDAIDSEIYRHEMAHALYYTNEAYRTAQDSIVVEYIEEVCCALQDLGYPPERHKDELQAYMVSGHEDLIYASDEDVAKYRKNYQKYEKLG